MAKFLLVALFLTLVPQSQVSAEVVGTQAKPKVDDVKELCGVNVRMTQKEAQTLRAQIEHNIATRRPGPAVLSNASKFLLRLKNNEYTVQCNRPLPDRRLKHPAPDWLQWILEPTPTPLSYPAQDG